MLLWQLFLPDGKDAEWALSYPLDSSLVYAVFPQQPVVDKGSRRVLTGKSGAPKSQILPLLSRLYPLIPPCPLQGICINLNPSSKEGGS